MKNLINISSFLPIKGRIIETDILEIDFKSTFTAYFDLHEIENYLRKKLNNAQLEISLIISDNEDIIFDLKSDMEVTLVKRIIEDYFSFNITKTLVNKYTNREASFINKDSGMPLIGTTAFGIIYRNTNIIEIRPITGCPLNCIFCSVDEGSKSRFRIRDYFIDEKYLIEEVEKLVNYIGNYNIEIHISAQGEPLTYPYLFELIEDLKKIKGINFISLQTNGILLSGEKIQKLKKAGLDRINLSINTLDEKKAKKITACKDYDINKIKKIAKDIVSEKIDLIIAPVVVPSINEEDMNEIISFAKEINAGKLGLPLGIQNYLIYKFSRKVKNVDQWDWKNFRKYLEKLEKEHNIKPLYLRKKDFLIHQRKKLPQPFRKNQIISIKIKLNGRMETERFAVLNERIIQIINCKKPINSSVKIKILSIKDNIITAQEI
ncbi:MAG: radical SAM protein [Candidatus Lokiarchaeota archaeon]|nr:radical SAM protein [Candidatus Lokiarchaeota archaeon]